MVTSITAYVSEDGQVHRDRREAEFADYNLSIRRDINRFLAEEKIADPAGGPMANLIAKWDLWRLGGYAGWAATMHSEDLPAPTSAASAAHGPKAVDTRQQELVLEVHNPVIVPAAPSPREPKPIPGDGKSSQFRRLVAVVALPAQYHQQIEEEFGDEFKLLLVDYANSMEKLESLRGYHKVIVMTRHAHPRTAAFLRAVGQEPLRVEGGIDNLRDALTGLYLATA